MSARRTVNDDQRPINPEGPWVMRGGALWAIFGVIVCATVWATSFYTELRQFRTDTEKRLSSMETNVQRIGTKLGVPIVLSRPTSATDMTDRLAVNNEREVH